MPLLIGPKFVPKLPAQPNFARANHRIQLQMLFERCRRDLGPNKRLALLLFDLDKFQTIFDLCGPAGADLMRQIIMQDRVRYLPEAHILHLTGGTYVCLLPHDNDRQLNNFIEKLRNIIAKPMWIDQHIVHLTACMGVALADTEEWADELLHAASLALSQAHQCGENIVRRFQPDMFVDMHARAQLESEFRSGLLRGQIIPFYQPIMDLSSGTPKGFEALARWRHPRLGILSPARFLTVASDLRLGGELLISMLRQICRDAQQWPDHLTASINISPTQLCDPQLAGQILRIVYASGLNPHRLTIEITEEAAIDNKATANDSIQAFRRAGFGIALDDFGAGHASFDRLSHLEIDQLKIDRTLVQGMDTERGRKLVAGIVSLGRTLSMKVTAEGIETAEQAQFAKEANCDWGQGYLFGEAVPAHIAERMAAQ